MVHAGTPICAECNVVMTATGTTMPIHRRRHDASVHPLVGKEYECAGCNNRIVITGERVRGSLVANPVVANKAKLALLHRGSTSDISEQFDTWLALATFLHELGYCSRHVVLRARERGDIYCDSFWIIGRRLNLAWHYDSIITQFTPTMVEYAALRGYMQHLEDPRTPELGNNWVHTWAYDDWSLRLFTTGEILNGRPLIAYDLSDYGDRIFHGEQANLIAVDGDPIDWERVALELLLLLSPGRNDTPNDFFAGYTPLQRVWHVERANDLRTYAYSRIEELDRIDEVADDDEQVIIGAPSGTRALRRVRLRS